MIGRGNVSLEGCTDKLVLASYPDCCRSIMYGCMDGFASSRRWVHDLGFQ